MNKLWKKYRRSQIQSIDIGKKGAKHHDKQTQQKDDDDNNTNGDNS